MACSSSLNTGDHTGLLTRFVPDKLKYSAPYRSLRFVRVLQFLASVVSLALFSRYYKAHLELTPDISDSADQPFRAVEGILVASVVYTMLSVLLMAVLRENGPKILRWLWVVSDIMIAGALIAVAVLTSPQGGLANSSHCSTGNTPGYYDDDLTWEGPDLGDNCRLVMGTFILAIINTVLQAITSAFHEEHDSGQQHHHAEEGEERRTRQSSTDKPHGELCRWK